MISFQFRAHPTMFLKIIKPYLFILILPFIRAFVQYVTTGNIGGTMFLEFIAIAFISILAFLGWRAVKIRVKKEKLIIEKGFFIKSKAILDISSIASISTKQNIIDVLTGSVTCFINTEAGSGKKNDFQLKLYKNDAKILTLLIYGKEKTKKASFSFLKIALLAAGTSSVVTGLIIGLPIIKKVEDFVNIAISDAFFKKIDNVTSNVEESFPSIFNLLTILFILAYGTSFLFSFLKKINFKLNIGKNVVKVQSGLIFRKNTIFKKQSINNICFEQTILMRFLKKYSMRASIAGYGDNKGESATIAPLVSKNSFNKHLKTYFGLVQYGEIFIAPKKDLKTHNRFLFIPMMIFILITTVAVVAAIKLPRFSSFIWFLAIILQCIDIYYASICRHDYKRSMFCPGEVLCVNGSIKFKIRKLYCAKSKLGIIKISQTPADRRFNTCKLKIIVRSESADCVRVKNLDLKPTIENINKLYKINISV